LSTTTVEVLVIGGGATGAAALYDLARRGVRALLVEQHDLSTGTSGRYHGLLHSGGRYVVSDPATAKECIDENRVLRRIAPFAIEDTGGLFVATPDDPADFVPKWVAGCAHAGIPIERLTAEQVRAAEPALTPRITAAYRIPDASCDSFDLIHAFVEAARHLGSDAWTYQRVTRLLVEGGAVVGAELEDTRTGAQRTVHAACVLNAAGPWAGVVAHQAGLDVQIKLNRGTMVAMNTRYFHTIVNRLRPPSDGDIFVPVGTVCVLGTTSIDTEDPADIHIELWEVSKMLAEAEPVIPGIREGRALRAWAGVRPLYVPPEDRGQEAANDHEVSRQFAVIDHAKRDNLRGLITVVGGKLTTCRLMAEHAVDVVLQQLGKTIPCTTADEPLPVEEPRRYHELPHRLHKLEHGERGGQLICECEIVSRPQLEAAIEAYGDQPVALDDLRRDLRLGMGPCQAGFCGYRAAGILQQQRGDPDGIGTRALADFVEERFRGVYPLLWGHQLRQFYLDELIYRRVLGLDALIQPLNAEEQADAG
jgi:glycerol-3-phosphate dehydrogenase